MSDGKGEDLVGRGVGKNFGSTGRGNSYQYLLCEKNININNFILIDKPRKYDLSKFQNKCNARYNHTYDKFTILKLVF